MKMRIKNRESRIKGLVVWGIVFILLLPNAVGAQTTTSTATGFEHICSGPHDGQPGTGLAVCVQQIYLFSLGFGALLALMMLVLAGYKYMTAEGNASQVESAKESFADAFIGLVIIFAAFILLNLINPDLVRFRDPSKTLSLPAINIGVAGTPPPEVNNTTNPNGKDLVTVAQRIMNNSHIILSTSADIPPWAARTTVQELSQGKYPTVCSPSRQCTATKNVVVNVNMLYGLLGLAEKYTFRLESLTTGVHSGASTHYTGRAVDIVPQPNSDRAMWQKVRDYLNGLHGKAICENKNDYSDVQDCNAGLVTHIHWTY